ncbi:MAG: hypothetical protein JSU90_07875 [Nitrospiraceae bacterium]|nr:MAG: hypothetical protein JSU90_07875 [Nitrospiraceae bacterium]
MFEVSLTRIFSVSLWYHFAFMVVSIAMLGIGGSGTLLAILAVRAGDGASDVRHRALYRLFCESPPERIALLAGLSLLTSYALSNQIPFDPARFSWDRAQPLFLSLYCMILSVPFFFAGTLIAQAFFAHSSRSMSIYSADLLGAGTGSLAVLAVLSSAGPEYAVLAASILCFVPGLFSQNKRTALLSLTILCITLLLGYTHPGAIQVRLSPYKSLSLALRYPGAEHLNTYYGMHSRIDTFRSPAVRFAPGLSLRYQDDLPGQTGFSIDGSEINAITDARDPDRLDFLRFMPSSAVYELTHDRGDVLIIDSGGGLQALMARHYGLKGIHIIESNPMIPEMIRRDFNTYAGRIFEKNTGTGYARNYLLSPNHGSYDVIDMPLTGTSVSGRHGIQEDYRYTVEAFETYLHALREEGILSISTYLIPPPRTELRIVATIISALENLSVPEPAAGIAAIRSWDSITILAKKTPFRTTEIRRIRDFTEDRRFDLVYYPGMPEEESNQYIKLPSDDYFIFFNKILNDEMRAPFLSHYLFDIRPVHDATPFPHYYLRLENSKQIYEIMGRKLLFFLEEGYLIIILFLIVSVLGALLILVPVLFGRSALRNSIGRPAAQQRCSFAVFSYFSLLGAGFMLVEVSLIQKSILLLENPSLSVAVVLTTLLISSGMGSMVSARCEVLRSPAVLLALSFMAALFSIVQPALFSLLLPRELILRSAAMAALVVPLGFLMGIPFPLGISVLGAGHRTAIPWAWAINGCVSVLAPVLTIMVALSAGFTSAAILGCLAYASACPFLYIMIKRSSFSAKLST